MHASLSQWMSTGPVHPETDIFESGKFITCRTCHNVCQVLMPDSPPAQCPPSFNTTQFEGGSFYAQPEDSIDSNLFSWPYEGGSGYDASFSSMPEPSTFSNTFSPSVSVVSCSPRSESKFSTRLSRHLVIYCPHKVYHFHHNLSITNTTPRSTLTLPTLFPNNSLHPPHHHGHRP